MTLQGARRIDPLEGVGPGVKLVLSADCGGTTTRYAAKVVMWVEATRLAYFHADRC